MAGSSGGRRRLRLHVIGLASLLTLAGAIPWPFGGEEDEGQQVALPDHARKATPQMFGMPPTIRMVSHGMPQGMPRGVRIAFGGTPVIMVRGGFGGPFGGFDPWEDLHRNMERVVHGSVQDAHSPLGLPGPGGAGGSKGRQLANPGGPASLEAKLNGLLGAFGEHHAGQVGRAQGSFHVDDDHKTRFRITAELPGYKLGDGSGGLAAAAESPLSVRAVGHRSLVVSGMQQNGPIIRTWQRSFSLPKGCDIENIEVTYSSSSGNLTVDVPRSEVSEEDSKDEDEEEAFLPPALRAMRQGMPGLVGNINGMPVRQGGGFLMPPSSLEDVLAQALGMVGQMHPRFHPPEGGEKEPPEDAEINMVGCFAESQLDNIDIKYYGESNAASFNSMYWHANNDHVQYFAMSRHGAALGHAFTAHGFAHEGEKPKWGIYDGCGARCEDDDSRWCGCSNEASRGFPNPACEEGAGEKHFAVYKIHMDSTPPPTMSSPEDGAPPTMFPDGDASEGAAQAAAPASPGRPTWQLTNNGDTIEITVPKGTVAKPNGRQVLLFNATVDDAGESETVGKMKMPVSLSPELCTTEEGKDGADGAHVLKCRLEDGNVKQIPIKVIDEL